MDLWLSSCPGDSRQAQGGLETPPLPPPPQRRRYLEAVELLGGLLLLPQAGVEDEELRVSQPHLQLLDWRLQLLQRRAVAERGRGGARAVQQGRLVLLGQDRLEEEKKKDERRRCSQSEASLSSRRYGVSAS